MFVEDVSDKVADLLKALENVEQLAQVGERMENNIVVKHRASGLTAVVTITTTRYVLRSPAPHRYTSSFSYPWRVLQDFAGFCEHHTRK